MWMWNHCSCIQGFFSPYGSVCCAPLLQRHRPRRERLLKTPPFPLEVWLIAGITGSLEVRLPYDAIAAIFCELPRSAVDHFEPRGGKTELMVVAHWLQEWNEARWSEAGGVAVDADGCTTNEQPRRSLIQLQFEHTSVDQSRISRNSTFNLFKGSSLNRLQRKLQN